jgi:hypothetical protein
MPHRGSPKVPSAEEVSAGFSPLYGKKKGLRLNSRAREVRWRACGQRPLGPRHMRRVQSIGLKAQEKSGSGRGASARRSR